MKAPLRSSVAKQVPPSVIFQHLNKVRDPVSLLLRQRLVSRILIHHPILEPSLSNATESGDMQGQVPSERCHIEETPRRLLRLNKTMKAQYQVQANVKLANRPTL